MTQRTSSVLDSQAESLLDESYSQRSLSVSPVAVVALSDIAFEGRNFDSERVSFEYGENAALPVESASDAKFEPLERASSSLGGDRRTNGPKAGRETVGEAVLSKLDNGVKIPDLRRKSLPDKELSVRSRSDFGGSDSRILDPVKVDAIGERKSRGDRIAERLLKTGRTELGKSLRSCGNRITLRNWISDDGNRIRKTDVRECDWCQKRILCSNCEKCRVARSMRVIIPRILAVLDQYPNHLLIFGTLTVRNGSNLVERVDHLFDSLSRLNKRAVDARRGRGFGNQFNKSDGSFWHMEVKRGQNSRLWHPHLHGLILRHKDERMIVQSLASEWHEISQDSNQVDLQLTTFSRMMLARKMSGRELFEHEPELLIKDLCEIMKYILKPDESMTDDDVIHCHLALKRKHLHRSLGEFRGLKVADDAANDVGGNGYYIDQVIQWERAEGKYRLDAQKHGFC